MRILFLSPSIPSPLHRIRALNLLKVLNADHEVQVVALAPAHDLAHTMEHVSFLAQPPRVVQQPFTRSLLQCAGALWTRTPLEIAYCGQPAMSAAVREEVESFAPDLVYVKRLRAAQFVPPSYAGPVVLDTTDAMSLSYRRMTSGRSILRPLFRREAWAYRKAERRLGERFHDWVTSSEEDAAYLRQHLPPSARVWVIPNVVDTEWFSPRRTTSGEAHLLQSGLMERTMNREAARWFAAKVLPRIREALADVRLTIAGPRPPRAVRALARERGVAVTGYIPDLRELMGRATVVVVPMLFGTGTRNKILQAWAMEKAVVATPAAAEGLDARSGENLLLATSPGEFASAVLLLLRDEALRVSLGRRGRETATRSYSLESLARALEPLLTILTPQAVARTP